MKFISYRSRYIPLLLLALLVVVARPLQLINSTSNKELISGEAGEQDPSHSYDLVFSTYLGGSDLEHARDVFVDGQGFVYIVGGTKSVDFPRTIGPAFNADRCNSLGSGGQFDVFITKYTPQGDLVWSRLLGSPCYDRAYAVEVDENGFVFVSGRAGEGFPVTAGAFQTEFKGIPLKESPLYGAQNGFIAKISPDGSRLVWASYVGATELVRDFDLDSKGNVVLNSGNPNFGTFPPAAWYAGAFQESPQGGQDCGVMKVTNDGTKVLWATWLGGPGEESTAASVRLDDLDYVYVLFSTRQDGVPTNPKSSPNQDIFDRTYNGGEVDGFLAKLTPDGADLVYGTYIGGNAADYVPSTHTLAVDQRGNAVIAVTTRSMDFPTTRGVFSNSHWSNNETDVAVVKFSPTGALLASTFVGGNGPDNADGIQISKSGEVLVTGETGSSNFPVQDALEIPALHYDGSVNHGQKDAFVIVVSADFSKLLFSTLMGGPAYDNGRSAFLGEDGSLYVTGSSSGAGWPVINADQDRFKGGSGEFGIGDVILARLTPQRVTDTSHKPTPTLIVIPTQKQNLLVKPPPENTNSEIRRD